MKKESSRGAPGPSDPAGVGLLLVDVVNGFDFEDSEPIVQRGLEVAPNIERLADSARQSRVPVIYVNDNFGMWQSDFRAVTESCLARGQPGRAVVERLLPGKSDYFVLKPRHSGFLGTPLEALLQHLRINAVVVAGFATDLCVLSTALDAYARGFHVAVASDCTAANNQDAERTALTLLHKTLRAKMVTSETVDWGEFAKLERKVMFA